MKKIIIILFVILSSTIIFSCYTDTINSLSTFTFQIPILFNSNTKDKVVPDTSILVTNLENFKQYKDNKEKLSRAEIISFNYWIDSILIDKTKSYNPKTDTVSFDFIKFYFRFGKLKANPPNPSNLNDTSNYFPDPKSPDYELGSFIDVNVTDYYRNPNHILIVQDSVIRFISSTIRMNPIFYIRAEYSKTRGQKTPKIVFPLIWARYDVIIRFTVKL